MSDLYTLDRHIANVGVIKDIVHSMRALSAVQFRRASEALVSVGAYAATLRDALSRLPEGVMMASPSVDKQLIVVMGSDQGLCGPLTRRLVECAQTHAESLGVQFAGFFAVGRQCRDLLAGKGATILSWRSAPISLRGTDALVAAIVRRIEKMVDAGACDGVDVVYARLLGVGSFQAETQRVLPIDPSVLGSGERSGRYRVPVRTYQSPEGIAAALLEEWGHTALYRAAIESLGSEHGARLEVTDAATHRVEKNLEGFRIQRNHLRQEEVTEEIQEVIRGVEGASWRGGRGEGEGQRATDRRP